MYKSTHVERKNNVSLFDIKNKLFNIFFSIKEYDCKQNFNAYDILAANILRQEQISKHLILESREPEEHNIYTFSFRSKAFLSTSLVRLIEEKYGHMHECINS